MDIEDHSAQSLQTAAPMKIAHYIVGKTIGAGTFGKVKCGEHIKTGDKVAIKILDRKKIKNLGVVEKIKKEVINLKLFRHPHIIRLYQVISSPTDIFMIMEYASGGELFEYIKARGKLTEVEARKFFQQIISGVDYCHRHMVVHRDLKPENLLLDHNRHVKIADFGLSNFMIDGRFLNTSCGSPNYAAPEVISGKLYAGPEVDVWSCGIILYALLCGTLPFDDESIPVLFRKIRSGNFYVPDYLNRHVVHLLHHMLCIEPLRRASIEDVKKHEWFQKHLPAYLFPPTHQVDALIIDDDAVQDVCKRLDVSAEEVKEALLSEDNHNELSIAYHLIVDNRRFNDGVVHRISSFYSVDASEPEPDSTNLENVTSLPERERRVSRNVHAKRPRWYLGIKAQSKPGDVMNRVFIAMKTLNFEWKVNDPFNVTARRKNVRTGRYVTMSLQLFSVDYKSYFLDFMVINPETDNCKRPDGAYEGHYVMEFLEMCAALIVELHS